jgi:hypothetical protein
MNSELAPYFQAVGDALRRSREALNLADTTNQNHGDHMVEIFEIAARVAEQDPDACLAESMELAGRELTLQAHNEIAQVYASGLLQMAEQFRKYDVTLEELVVSVQAALLEDKDQRARMGSPRSGEVLKALAGGLAAWSQAADRQAPAPNLLNMGILFEFGMAYLQAKQRGGDRASILADAAASVSPLREVPYRYESAKLAIRSLLLAMLPETSDQYADS